MKHLQRVSEMASTSCEVVEAVIGGTRDTAKTVKENKSLSLLLSSGYTFIF